MRKIAIALAAGLLAVTGAQASEELAKANGCLNCHTVDKKKMGPALKTVAADWKKGNVDVAKGVANIKAKHPDLKAKDEDLTKIATWIKGM